MSASTLVGSIPQEDLVDSPVISVRDLVHRYDDRAALNGVSFDVRPAELFGLLGPNGSGKTTLFRILSTLMVPVAGQAIILGHDAAKEPSQLRREIGVVFQAQSVDLKLTASENLQHQGHLYGLSGGALEARQNEMLARLGLTDRRRDRVETLSGGLRRRVELAKGMLHRPRLLLLDEPSTGLDPGARSDLWDYLQQVRRDEALVTERVAAARARGIAVANMPGTNTAAVAETTVPVSVTTNGVPAFAAKRSFCAACR